MRITLMPADVAQISQSARLPENVALSGWFGNLRYVGSLQGGFHLQMVLFFADAADNKHERQRGERGR
jgi:hypothetical protein